jgi:D-alanine-D-alanine ligase
MKRCPRPLSVLMLVDREVLVPGRTQFASGQLDRHIAESIRRLGHRCFVTPFTRIPELLRDISQWNVDVVFNLTQAAMGQRSMDLHICAVFELEGVPYTGTGPRGLMLGRDKAVSKAIAASCGFRVPAYFVVNSTSKEIAIDPPYPIIVKPRYGDSSEGIYQSSIVSTRSALEKRIAILGRKGISEVICEEFVEGREMAVGILCGRVLPPREFIVGRSGKGAPRVACERFKYDESFRRKWGLRTDFAQLTPSSIKQLRIAALKVSIALEMRDYARLAGTRRSQM